MADNQRETNKAQAEKLDQIAQQLATTARQVAALAAETGGDDAPNKRRENLAAAFFDGDNK